MAALRVAWVRVGLGPASCSVFRRMKRDLTWFVSQCLRLCALDRPTRVFALISALAGSKKGCNWVRFVLLRFAVVRPCCTELDHHNPARGPREPSHSVPFVAARNAETAEIAEPAESYDCSMRKSALAARIPRDSSARISKKNNQPSVIGSRPGGPGRRSVRRVGRGR